MAWTIMVVFAICIYFLAKWALQIGNKVQHTGKQEEYINAKAAWLRRVCVNRDLERQIERDLADPSKFNDIWCELEGYAKEIHPTTYQYSDKEMHQFVQSALRGDRLPFCLENIQGGVINAKTADWLLRNRKCAKHLLVKKHGFIPSEYVSRISRSGTGESFFAGAENEFLKRYDVNDVIMYSLNPIDSVETGRPGDAAKINLRYKSSDEIRNAIWTRIYDFRRNQDEFYQYIIQDGYPESSPLWTAYDGKIIAGNDGKFPEPLILDLFAAAHHGFCGNTLKGKARNEKTYQLIPKEPDDWETSDDLSGVARRWWGKTIVDKTLERAIADMVNNPAKHEEIFRRLMDYERGDEWFPLPIDTSVYMDNDPYHHIFLFRCRVRFHTLAPDKYPLPEIVTERDKEAALCLLMRTYNKVPEHLAKACIRSAGIGYIQECWAKQFINMELETELKKMVETQLEFSRVWSRVFAVLDKKSEFCKAILKPLCGSDLLPFISEDRWKKAMSGRPFAYLTKDGYLNDPTSKSRTDQLRERRDEVLCLLMCGHGYISSKYAKRVAQNKMAYSCVLICGDAIKDSEVKTVRATPGKDRNDTDRTTILSVVKLMAVVLVVALLFLMPTLIKDAKYDKALNHMESGEMKEAISVLTDLKTENPITWETSYWRDSKLLLDIAYAVDNGNLISYYIDLNAWPPKYLSDNDLQRLEDYFESCGYEIVLVERPGEDTYRFEKIEQP